MGDRIQQSSKPRKCSHFHCISYLLHWKRFSNRDWGVEPETCADFYYTGEICLASEKIQSFSSLFGGQVEGIASAYFEKTSMSWNASTSMLVGSLTQQIQATCGFSFSLKLRNPPNYQPQLNPLTINVIPPTGSPWGPEMIYQDPALSYTAVVLTAMEPNSFIIR